MKKRRQNPAYLTWRCRMADNLMKFTGSEYPVFNRPFTVIDPQGQPWGISSDKVWLVAVKGLASFSRFKGSADSLGVVLKLIRMASHDDVDVLASEIADRIIEDLPLISILGVSVKPLRLKELLLSSPSRVKIWNCSTALGVPSVAFFSKDWKAFLMGYENVSEEVPSLDLAEDQQSLFDLAMSLDKS